MKNLVLIGLMGTFKSSAGKKAARLLKMNFADTDTMIEEQEKMTVPQIFEKKGEEHFRELENRLSVKLKVMENTVISTGGGFALNAENINVLKDNSVVVWLTADPIELFDRIKKSRRPFVINGGTAQSLGTLLKSREDKYSSAADAVINNTALSSTETAKRLVAIMQNIK